MEPQQHSIVINAINERVGSRTIECLLCGSSQWVVQDRIANLALQDSPSGPYTRSLPLACVMCQTCGFTFFVNVLILGVGQHLGIQAVE